MFNCSFNGGVVEAIRNLLLLLLLLLLWRRLLLLLLLNGWMLRLRLRLLIVDWKLIDCVCHLILSRYFLNPVGGQNGVGWKIAVHWSNLTKIWAAMVGRYRLEVGRAGRIHRGVQTGRQGCLGFSAHLHLWRHIRMFGIIR